MSSNYYLGTTPAESLGDSPRYWYALRRNVDGELFLVRSDQISDLDAYELNIPGPPEEDFDDFEAGVDYFDGLDTNHELVDHRKPSVLNQFIRHYNTLWGLVIFQQ